MCFRPCLYGLVYMYVRTYVWMYMYMKTIKQTNRPYETGGNMLNKQTRGKAKETPKKLKQF